MKKLIGVPLVFLLVASCIGWALRWHHFSAIPGFHYGNWLHAHSHAMFLGWVFNALSVAFVIAFVSGAKHKRYYPVLVLANAALAGMVVLFPIMGYAAPTIILSAIHTVIVFVYCGFFFRDTWADSRRQAVSCARISLLFFIVSAAGPVALAFVNANGLGHTYWYRYAVYYYLHFQYNGTFTFGVFSLQFLMLEKAGISIAWERAKTFKRLLAYACVPAFFLSILWNQPGMAFNLTGLLAASLQWLAWFYWFTLFKSKPSELNLRLAPVSFWLLVIANVCFTVKLALQFISAHPGVALLADSVRYYNIAYLHLVLIGMISFALLAWYRETQRLPWLTFSHLFLMVSGFIGSELVMAGVSWLAFDTLSLLLVISSGLIVIGMGWAVINYFRVQDVPADRVWQRKTEI
jgi:hypothetical protein